VETVSRLVLTFLLNALWQVALVACVGAVCNRLMRRAPAKYRHAVWVMVLAAGLVLPVNSAWSAWNSAQFPTLVTPTVQGAPLQSLPALAGNSGLQSHEPAATRLNGPASSITRGLDFIQRRTKSIAVSRFMTLFVLACYAISLMLNLRRLWRAWRKTKKIEMATQTREIPAAMASSARHCNDLLGLARVPILSSAQIAGPMTLGARSPVIILPESMFLDASAADMTSVFAHEMAHILRRDFLMNLIYELVSLPISFHPATKLIKRRINETRELACDQIAAGRVANPPDYARSLVELARRMSTAPELSRSGYSLGVFDANILEERVMRILDQKSLLGSRLAKAIFAAGVFLLAASCIFASAFSLSVSQKNDAPSDDTLRPFVGTWKAKLKGKPYVTVALDIADHKLAGKITSYRVILDDNGHPADVTEKPDVCPVTGAKVEGKNLTLRGDCFGRNAQEFAIRLTGDREMEFRVVGAPPPPDEESGGLKLTMEPEESSELPAEVKPFIGTWQANFKGKPFMTLELASDGYKFIGTMSPCRIVLGANGELTEATRNDHGTGWHIVGAHFDGTALTLRAKEDGADDVDQFEMKLTGENDAEFKPVSSPMPVEPWKMTRGDDNHGGHLAVPPSPPPPPPPPRFASLDQNVRPVLAGQGIKGLDFSGRWELAKTKSSMPSPSPDNLVEQIEQRGAQLKISTTSKDWDTSQPISATLFALTIPEVTVTPDNLERDQKFGPGELVYRTHWEGGKVVTDWKLLHDGEEVMTGKWSRSLSDDGKTQILLVDARNSQGSSGEATLMFVKKVGG